MRLKKKEYNNVKTVKLLGYFNATCNEWNIDCIYTKISAKQKMGRWLEGKPPEEIKIDDPVAFITFNDNIKSVLLSFTTNSIKQDDSNWDDFVIKLASKKLFYSEDQVKKWGYFKSFLEEKKGVYQNFVQQKEEFEFYFTEIRVILWDLNSICKYLEFLVN